MKQLTFFLIFTSVCFSCKREYAHFQISSYPNYSPKKNKLSSEIIQLNHIETPLVASNNDLPLNYVEESIPQQNLIIENELVVEKKVLPDKGKRKKRNKATLGEKIDNFIERNFSKNQTKSQEKSKKSKKHVPLNSTIYSGFVMLGLAILLALLSLNSLSIIFGIAAVIFLFMGFKRYFRKIQRRNLFR